MLCHTTRLAMKMPFRYVKIDGIINIADVTSFFFTEY